MTTVTLWQNLDYWTLTNNNFNLEKKDREQAVSRTGQKIRPEVLNCSYHNHFITKYNCNINHFYYV